MLTIRNRKNQPFTFHLKDGKSLYLGPRGTGTIANASLSDELTKARDRGLVEIQEPQSAEPAAETSDSNKSSGRKK